MCSSQRAREAGGSLNLLEREVRVDSSPDNDGTDQYCQMVRVRLARQKGVREEPATESSSRQPAAGGWRIGAAQQRTPLHQLLCAVTLWSVDVADSGGHGECLRRSRGDVAGA